MGYFQPIVIYRNPEDVKENSIIRYIGNRVLRLNKNMLIAMVGSTGAGKSYACLKIAEEYSRMFNIPFDPNIHVITSLIELLRLITAEDLNKKIRPGSIIVFDEPQIEDNARNWQSEMNQAFSALVSTFRNQRLIVLFAVPYLDMIDKQSRKLFHAEFHVIGYDINTKITKIKPRFLEYDKKRDDFYRKRLIIEYATVDKTALTITKLNFWNIGLASKETIDTYEDKKKCFTDNLNKKLLNRLELNEKQDESKNKNSEFLKIKDLFNQYGENYEKIIEEMPHLSPFTIEKYLHFIKKSRGISIKRRSREKIEEEKDKKNKKEQKMLKNIQKMLGNSLLSEQKFNN